MLTLVSSSRGELLQYVNTQLVHFFPDGRDTDGAIERHLDTALGRLSTCINAVKMWPRDEFHYLHSSQYTIFLYFLANTIWVADHDRDVCTKLFLLNKALNGIDCFFEVELPPIFFIGHSLGIVLAKATYGNYLVLYQNVTVGKNHGVAPVIGEGVVMYPGTAIIGRSHVGSGSVISQGVSVVNRDIPGNSLVFQGLGAELVYRQISSPAKDEFFRT